MLMNRATDVAIDAGHIMCPEILMHVIGMITRGQPILEYVNL